MKNQKIRKVRKNELRYHWCGRTHRTDNESFVKAWQSSITIEEFIELTGDEERPSRARATRMRKRGIPLKRLRTGNTTTAHLIRLAEMYNTQY